MTWVRLPTGKIRLYASRKLTDLAWGQRTDADTYTVRWHLDGTMEQVLVVDRETAAEALQWVLERWAREDAEEAARIKRLHKHAIDGHVVSDSRALTHLTVKGELL